MIDITFNIGYRGSLGSGMLNKFPIYYRFESFKEFSDHIRNNAFEWSLWAHDNYVSKSHLCFYVNICLEYDGEFHFLDMGFNNLEKTKINDDIKSNFCSSNSIKLIRIPYTEFEHIERILNENLQK
jgi:hypothetical protein